MNKNKRHTSVLKTFSISSLLALSIATPAMASLHTWNISEIYNDSSSGIQFIELVNTNNNNQDQFQDAVITSTASSFTFPSNLSVGTATANLRLLLGNAAYNAAPGSVDSDYLLPDNFFSAAGDTINFAAGTDAVTFTNLPTDGSNSFNYSGDNGAVLTTAANSPTNLSLEVGSVPEPSSALLLITGGLAVLFGRKRK
jgi:hypothetical protein|tara:strand:+ start:219 stop:812 length:594 start_codon:yes stop_codon:yes gene_type:complete